MKPEYGIYIDVFFATNFIIDFLALFFTGILHKRWQRWYRLLFAGLFGSFFTVLLFVLLRNFTLYTLLLHLVIHPVMLRMAWRPVRHTHFLKDYGTAYLLLWLLGGLMNWGLELASNGIFFWLWVLAGFLTIFFVTRFWGNRKTQDNVWNILLQTESRSFPLKGFLDTGNLLRDPLGNRPVHIIEETLLHQELKEHKLHVRLIPYHSLGEEKGMMPVVTLKGMYIRRQGQKHSEKPVYIEKPVLGLTKEKLFQKKDYQILLNAQGIFDNF